MHDYKLYSNVDKLTEKLYALEAEIKVTQEMLRMLKQRVHELEQRTMENDWK